MAGWGVDPGRRRAFPADARPRYPPAARPFILRPAQDERTGGYPGGVDGAAGMTRRLAAGMGGGAIPPTPLLRKGGFSLAAFPSPTVIPAPYRHSRESGNPRPGLSIRRNSRGSGFRPTPE